MGEKVANSKVIQGLRPKEREVVQKYFKESTEDEFVWQIKNSNDDPYVTISGEHMLQLTRDENLESEFLDFCIYKLKRRMLNNPDKYHQAVFLSTQANFAFSTGDEHDQIFWMLALNKDLTDNTVKIFVPVCHENKHFSLLEYHIIQKKWSFLNSWSIKVKECEKQARDYAKKLGIAMTKYLKLNVSDKNFVVKTVPTQGAYSDCLIFVYYFMKWQLRQMYIWGSATYRTNKDKKELIDKIHKMRGKLLLNIITDENRCIKLD